uniref:ATP synthase subunit a n=1 Tax=Enicospilus sp. MD-2008 TaxID=576951 RepID=C4NCI5_9HYME|nr:ATP synthase F0 subunit 6 [Enicospilus sp. MD-2008]
MMSNLFSIFDPNNNQFFDMNWISSMTNILIIPMNYWFIKSRLNKLMSIILILLFKEFKIILLNKFNMLNIIYFISLFMFILMNNFMGLFPYIFTSSSHLIFSLMISFPFWLSLMMLLWINNTNFAFSHLIPQSTPFVLMPFMVLIETISNMIRPMTLSVRLTANMIAGHLLLTLLSNSAYNSNFMISISIIIIQILLLLLEFSVSIIQSYVFTILMILYIKETN